MDESGMIRGSGADEADRARVLARGWFLLFCLCSVWVYTIRSGAAFLYIWSDLQNEFLAVSIFEYPVQILGVCVLPWLFERCNLTSCPRGNARVFAALLGGSLALMAAIPFVSGFALPLLLYYLLILFTATTMGLSLRRGAMLWDSGHAALYIGGAYILYYMAEYIAYYSFFATNNPFIYLACAFALFAGLLIAALVVRLRLKDGFEISMPASIEPYPKPLIRIVILVLALHALFSTAVNTVWYFDNMDDFHTFGYELFFNLLALAVMGAAVYLFHKRRWFGTTLSCLLVLCLGQGLTLWGIENMPLAISYNLVTMASKMPPHLLGLIAPVWYATARRKSNLACLGFGITGIAEFLLMLTQLRPGTLSVIPRQGALLLIGLTLSGLIVWLYLKFQKIQTGELLRSIRISQDEHKTLEQMLDALNLTPREHEVAGLLLSGDSQKIIAAKLNISNATVGFHTKNLYRKLNIQSRAELFALFIEPAAGGVRREVSM